MQLDILILSEVGKTKTNIIYMARINLSTKQKQIHRRRGEICGYQGGGRKSGMDGEFGASRCKLLHLEWISNEVLHCSTGKYIQSLGLDHDGK